MPFPAEGPSRRLPAPCRQESFRTRQESSIIVAYKVLRLPRRRQRRRQRIPKGPDAIDSCRLPSSPRRLSTTTHWRRLQGPSAPKGARGPHNAAWLCGCTGAWINISCALVVARSKTLMPRARAESPGRMSSAHSHIPAILPPSVHSIAQPSQHFEVRVLASWWISLQYGIFRLTLGTIPCNPRNGFPLSSCPRTC